MMDSKYDMLFHMINISKEKIDDLRKREDCSLILYYLVKESGADKKWDEAKDYYDSQFDPKNESTWYICDSEYESYFRFQDLKKNIQESVGIKGKYFSYADYIEEYLPDLKNN